MKIKIVKSLLIFVLSIGFIACKKSQNLLDNKKNSRNTSKTQIHSRTAEEEELINQLIQDFGLHILSSQEMGNTQFPSFTDYQSAANYIIQMQQNLSQNVSGSTETIPGGPPPVNKFADPPPPNCALPGTYHSNLGGSGGFFSSFNVYFSTNGTGVTSASLYVTGFPIGWSWTAVGSTFTGNSYNGCVGGYITNGFQVGGVTLGWNQSYHFNFYFNPTTCTLLFSQGSGSC